MQRFSLGFGFVSALASCVYLVGWFLSPSPCLTLPSLALVSCSDLEVVCCSLLIFVGCELSLGKHWQEVVVGRDQGYFGIGEFSFSV